MISEVSSATTKSSATEIEFTAARNERRPVVVMLMVVGVVAVLRAATFVLALLWWLETRNETETHVVSDEENRWSTKR